MCLSVRVRMRSFGMIWIRISVTSVYDHSGHGSRYQRNRSMNGHGIIGSFQEPLVSTRNSALDTIIRMNLCHQDYTGNISFQSSRDCF